MPSGMLSTHAIGRRVDDRYLWRDLTINVAPGTRIGVTGPSGSGKTLLLRALAGLDPPDEGKIIFAARAQSAWAMPEYRARIAYLPQTPALLEGTVEDNLRTVLAFGVHRRRSYDAPWIVERLHDLGRPESFLEKDVTVLSGGERQIVAFLRALQLEPVVLLLDEPTANLDAAATEQLERLVAAWLAADGQRASVWTSHRPDQLERVTDRQVDLTEFRANAT